jgi:hypothetical protein
MQKQFASFNTFVSRQTLSYSSCDGLCTDQYDTAAYVHPCDDIAVVCSKLSPTSHLSNFKRNTCRAWLSHANAQRTPVRLLLALKCGHCASSCILLAQLSAVTARPSNQPCKQRSHRPSDLGCWTSDLGCWAWARTLVRYFVRRSSFLSS